MIDSTRSARGRGSVDQEERIAVFCVLKAVCVRIVYGQFTIIACFLKGVQVDGE